MKTLRFGPNELDSEAFELRRSGVRVPLSRLPFDLLALLISRRGTLVTREEIAAHLWKDPELVDTVGGINTAIKKIRAVLNDDAAIPRYIETVIGRGYRFVGEVQTVEANFESAAVALARLPVALLQPARESEAVASIREPAPSGSAPRRFGRWVILAAAVTVALLTTAYFLRKRHAPERMPLLEPVQITNNGSDNRVEAGALSPNGRLLAYIDPDGFFVRELGSGATHALKYPAGLQSNRVEWYPDDLRILISGVGALSNASEIWALSVMGVPPRLIRMDARNGVPSPDGSRIAFTTGDSSEIWVADSDGENSQPFLKAPSGETYPFVFWSERGDRLNYQLQHEMDSTGLQSAQALEANYEWEYVSRSIRNRHETAHVKGIRFESACETNGRLFYLHTNPWQDGPRRGIWQVPVDANGAFRGISEQLASTSDYAAYGLSVARDAGSLAAVLERGQADVYIGSFRGKNLANVHRLTSNTKRDFPHAWMPGGDAVIFESDRNGAFHLFRQKLTQRTAEQLTYAGGVQTMPQVTPDGKWILYESLRDKYPSAGDALERLSIDGGAPQQVALPHSPWDFACPLLRGTCILRELLDNRTFAFYELDPQKGKGREVARTARVANAFGAWALSADGRTIALPIPAAQGSQIRLIPLYESGSERRESVVNVLAPGRILNLNWSSDGAGWFAENSRNGRSSLVYIDQNSHEYSLRETIYPTWGVPSRGGQRIAFLDYSFDSNVWVWKP